MAEERDNSGVLFKNDKKTKPNHPDSYGFATVDGVKKRVAGWWKDGKNGKFLSLAFSPDEEGGNKASKTASKTQQQEAEEFNW